MSPPHTGDFRSKNPSELRSQTELSAALKQILRHWYLNGHIKRYDETVGGLRITFADDTAATVIIHNADEPIHRYPLPGDRPQFNPADSDDYYL